jgi:hypothetical protein
MPSAPPLSVFARGGRTGRAILGLVVASAFATGLEGQQRSTPPTRRTSVPPPTRRAVDSAAIRKAAADSAAADSTAKASQIPYGAIMGVVYDSLHQIPLVGAAVMAEGTARITQTASNGRFRLDSLPPGKYRVFVDHVLLDSLGMAMRTDSIEVAPNDERYLEMSVPSPETLVALSCPASRRALGPSAIIGRLLDAESGEPIEGGRVSMAWQEISIADKLRRVPRVRDALSGPDGVYRICGLPASLAGTLQAMHKGISTAEVRLTIEGDPLVVQGLRIGSAQTVAKTDDDSSAVRRAKEISTGPTFSAATMQTGNAVLTGRVVNAAGGAVVNARVDVVGTPGKALTNHNGDFTMSGLPSGTQSLVVRQLGYAPVEVPVELSTRAAASVKVTMSKPATVLDPVVVRAEGDAGLDRVGFSSRKRSGGGYYMTGEEVMKRGPNALTDVFRTVPGLRVVPSGTDYVVESSRSTLGGCVKYWIDGAVFEAIFPGDVDRILPPWEIAAIEVYHGANTPVQFQAAGASSCTNVVMWSKTRVERPGAKK